MTSDAGILKELYRVGADGISGAALAEHMQVSRAAIWARIEELRRVGFVIEASPHLGYRLLESPDRLLGDDLKARLGPVRVIGREVQVFRETASTNELVERLARDGVAEGAVVIAEEQSQGRGRLGRTWVSPAGQSILMSVLLRPNLGPQEVTQLTIMAATAITRAIQRVSGVRAAIKWPNDVVMGRLKLAGVLTEMNAEPERVRHVVLGMGLNVNQERDDFPPELRDQSSSVRLQAGQPCSRASLAVALLEELDRDYSRVLEGRFMEVATEWKALCSTLGQTVRVQMEGAALVGCAEAIDDAGALLLRTADGKLRRIVGGDVTLDKGTSPSSGVRR